MIGLEEDVGTDLSPATDGASDRVLAHRAGLGDSVAFEELFSRHFHATYRYAVHMLTGAESLAEETTQEAWVKVWRHLPDYRGEAAVRTWLFRIVARQVLDARRRRRPVLIENTLLEPLPAKTDVEDGVLEGELWRALTVALAELPWRQRASWLLRELDGLSYAETAKVLETTPTVVRGQLHRARAALAIRMEQWR